MISQMGAGMPQRRSMGATLEQAPTRGGASVKQDTPLSVLTENTDSPVAQMGQPKFGPGAQNLGAIAQQFRGKYPGLPPDNYFNSLRDAQTYIAKWTMGNINPAYEPDGAPKLLKNGQYEVKWNNVTQQNAAKQISMLEFWERNQNQIAKLDLQKENALARRAQAFNQNAVVRMQQLRLPILQQFDAAADSILSGHSKSPGTADLAVLDEFVRFAAGKVPTEAQYHAAATAYDGLLAEVQRNWWKYAGRGFLRREQIQEMRDIMYDSYNLTTRGLNPMVEGINRILDSKHPNLLPEERPHPWPILRTSAYLTEELETVTEKLSKLKRTDPGYAELLKKAEEISKEAAIAKKTGKPTNLREFRDYDPAKVPGWNGAGISSVGISAE